MLKDHLGSPSLIMSKTAQVEQTLDFDPWGARRTTNWAAMGSTELTNTFFKNHSVSNSVGTDSLTSRGFTGHEMLDEVGVIHMNGRIYDAKLARFLQADPHIQAPYDTQSLNRYSYTRNNPLNATDPTGYFFSLIVGLIAVLAEVELIVAVVMVGTAAFFETLAMGGSFGDALLAGFTSAALTFAGGKFLGDKILTGLEAFKLGVIGGIGSVLQGGKFGHGFISSGAGSFIGAKIGGFVKGAETALRNTGTFLAKVTLGGAISKATGGKFANGAGFAAFSAAVSYAAISNEVPVSASKQKQPETLQEKADRAAMDKLDKYNPKSIAENNEYAGLVYKSEGGVIGATDAIAGSGCNPVGSCSNPFDAEHLLPNKATVIGDYHTHGVTNVEGTDIFSVDDVLRVDAISQQNSNFSGSYMSNGRGEVYFYSSENTLTNFERNIEFVNPMKIRNNSRFVGGISK
jgi:RHS repeat-associated protein